MSAKPDGGPMFPHGDHNHGASLRDWFAGQALNGLTSQPDDRSCPRDRIEEVEKWRKEVKDHDAKWAYQMADAMLEARKREAK